MAGSKTETYLGFCRRAGKLALGVNAVAARAGVSKVLIYRYFESLDGLIAAYIRTHDFWIDYRPELPKKKHLGIFLKQIGTRYFFL